MVMTGLSLNLREADWMATAERIATSRWAPTVATLIAVTLLSYSLAQWSWRLVKPPISTSAPVMTTAKIAAPEAASTLRDLLAANLFGMAPLGNAAYSPDTLPVTSLNLVLTGVMVRGQGSYALIRIDGGDETPVTIGEELLAGARLHSVYPDRVVLARGGGYEVLLLKETIPALPPGSVTMNNARPASTAESGVRANGNQYTVDRDVIQRQMQRPEFLSQALIVPNTGGGFLVRDVQAGSLYEKLGVRVGDVIRSVNGQPVNNIEDVMKLYQSMGGIQQAGNIALDVTRGGRNQQLQYRFE
jgi:general secretion pathway protein C